MAIKIDGRAQLRGGTKAELTARNEILLAKEICFETDTLKFKLGDGVHNYNDLQYVSTGSSGIEIPRLQMKVTRSGTPGAVNTSDKIVWFRHNFPIDAEFLKHNPKIVLMRKKSIGRTRNGFQENASPLKRGAGKWVDVGSSYDGSISNAYIESLKNKGATLDLRVLSADLSKPNNFWYNPLYSGTTIYASAKYLVSPFVVVSGAQNLNTAPFLTQVKLYTAGKKRMILPEKMGQVRALFGFAIRIDNPLFETTSAPPGSSSFNMYKGQPRYLYGEICRCLFTVNKCKNEPADTVCRIDLSIIPI